MLAQTDKRSDERIASNASIIFSLFSILFWREYPSMTRNHSEPFNRGRAKINILELAHGPVT